MYVIIFAIIIRTYINIFVSFILKKSAFLIQKSCKYLLQSTNPTQPCLWTICSLWHLPSATYPTFNQCLGLTKHLLAPYKRPYLESAKWTETLPEGNHPLPWIAFGWMFQNVSLYCLNTDLYAILPIRLLFLKSTRCTNVIQSLRQR